MTTHDHIIYDMTGCSTALLASIALGKAALERTCREAHLTVVGEFGTTFAHGGYSCGLLLSESHVSLHTWPELDYCAVDLFLCGGDVQKAEATLCDQLQPKTHTRRVLRRGANVSEPATSWIGTSDDTGAYREEYRASKLLARCRSRHQLIEIIENPVYGKLLMLDGDVQVATSDEAIYHELLVHPAMLAHPNARNVAILGGGDGGALREVLKYDQVRRAVLVDIDRDVISHCRRLLPEVCRGSFDDPRTELVHEDVGNWLGKEVFDLVIVDLTAPTGPSVGAYTRLLADLKRSLTSDGFVSMHSGWWGADPIAHVPSDICRAFHDVLLNDRWVESFKCFWSFVVGWYHDEEALSVLRRISGGNPPRTEHFHPHSYALSSFVRPQLTL